MDGLGILLPESSYDQKDFSCCSPANTRVAFYKETRGGDVHNVDQNRSLFSLL
jgi:hypothetical protein